MRRGRALLPHPEPLDDDTGRRVVTRQLLSLAGGVHISWIRRNLEPVACHLGTKAPLYDLADAETRIATRSSRCA